ncbi:hypothetical protein [Serratia marcescens]|uniref:hypothetical protein n=1 Tax=Serratia marcescens TaxID=615 RepID=UPI001600B545|nr:hypothetical protein [Serratia marcescens]
MKQAPVGTSTGPKKISAPAASSRWPHRRQYQPMFGKIEAHVRRYAVQLLVKRDGAVDFAFANVDPNQHARLTQR